MRCKPARVPALLREVVAGAEFMASPASAPNAEPRRPEFDHARRLLGADPDLIWVSQDMTRQAVDGARDVPPTALSAAWPSPRGMLVYDGGLPTVSPEGMGTVTPSVMTWLHDGEHARLTLWVHRTDLPPGWAERAPDGVMLPVGTDVIDATEPVDLDQVEHPLSVRVISLALSTWVMMQTPTMADARDTTQAGPKVGKSGRRDVDRTVKVVELRRLAHKPAEPTDDPGRREYRHRWVVRGHWRQQAMGPGRALRETIWIPPHVKGPEQAPFLPTETVFAWRR